MNKLLKLLFFITPILLFAACDKVNEKDVVQMRVPIFEKMASIRADEISVLPAKSLHTSGKIYIYEDYLFINEPLEGIHIFDNSNPANPKAVSFVKIPGNVDMAIKDDALYVDSYVDLLTFNLSNPSKPDLIDREKDVFQSLYVYGFQPGREDDRIVVGYKDTLVRYDNVNTYNPFDPKKDMYYLNSSVSEVGSTYGQGGSMARFTLAQEHLYAVDASTLHLFDVRETSNPRFVKNIPLGWGIETIFPYKDKLFIGSNTGMFIYDIANASNPVQLARYSHVRACDPVVVNDTHAFVTLRTGAICAGTANVLEVLDIRDLKNPVLVKSYQMQNPHGLALAGNVLYLCEGKYGFKSFNAADVFEIGNNRLEHLQNLNSTDVIPGPKSLIVIGEDGVCQYDYSDKSKLKLLSCISRNIEK